MATQAPAAIGITPYELSRQITLIVAEVCGCSHTWMLHPGPCTPGELDAISRLLLHLIAARKMEAQR